VFDNAPAAQALIGELHNGWQQMTSELALERSGPDRFLAAFKLLRAKSRAIGPDPRARGHRPRPHHLPHPGVAADVRAIAE
jgi:hypothetical protein